MHTCEANDYYTSIPTSWVSTNKYTISSALSAGNLKDIRPTIYNSQLKYLLVASVYSQ